MDSQGPKLNFRRRIWKSLRAPLLVCLALSSVCVVGILIDNSRGHFGDNVLESESTKANSGAGKYIFSYTYVTTHPDDPVGESPPPGLVLPALYNASAWTAINYYPMERNDQWMQLSTSHGFVSGYTGLEIRRPNAFDELFLFLYKNGECYYKITYEGKPFRIMKGRLSALIETTSSLPLVLAIPPERSLLQIKQAFAELQKVDHSWEPPRKYAWLRLYERVGNERELSRWQIRRIAEKHQQRLMRPMLRLRRLLEQ
jgi:hypothetical protein